MPHIPDSTDPKDWHRYFAIENNNRAWELATGSRTEKENQEMLNSAHASALHWDLAGNELNHIRAKTLLAEVHALLGYGSSALAYIEEVREFLLKQDSADWEIALLHTIHAHAACVASSAVSVMLEHDGSVRQHVTPCHVQRVRYRVPMAPCITDPLYEALAPHAVVTLLSYVCARHAV